MLISVSDGIANQLSINEAFEHAVMMERVRSQVQVFVEGLLVRAHFQAYLTIRGQKHVLLTLVNNQVEELNLKPAIYMNA